MNFRQYVTDALQLGGGHYRERLFGFLAGWMGDATAEASRLALAATWLRSPEVPDDAIGSHGWQRLIERYPFESIAQYRARLLDAWEAWRFAGTAASIIGQLARAGMPGGVIFTARDWPDRPPMPWWSQFWIVWLAGTHTVGPPRKWDGSGVKWDDGMVWDSDLTEPQVELAKRIVEKWRPSHVVCRGMLFETSTPRWDTGHAWDDVGLEWGGIAPEVTI